MAQAITAFFRTRQEGEAAQNALLDNGFTRGEVSYMAAGANSHELPRIGPLRGTGAESEAASDAFLGSLVGLAAGTVAAFLPGVGPVFAVGPIAAAIGGAALGGAAGGLIGLLRDHGVSEEEAEFYSQGIANGGSLITVHEVDAARAQKARALLDQFGAIKVEDLASEADEVHHAS